jgi:hypothetical protein
MRGRRNERASALNGIIASIFVLGSAFIGASAARADEIAPPAALDSVGPKQPITAYNGSYTYSILIEVPDSAASSPNSGSPMIQREASAMRQVRAAGSVSAGSSRAFQRSSGCRDHGRRLRISKRRPGGAGLPSMSRQKARCQPTTSLWTGMSSSPVRRC